jgi:hypothetical protein
MKRLRHGKHRKRKLGVHKGFRSPGVREWNEANLPPLPEECAGWLDPETYARLLALRHLSAVKR